MGVIKLNIFCFGFLALSFCISHSQECNSYGIKCISCTEYQKCNAGQPEEAVISCANEEECSNLELERCRKELNCYAVIDCIDVGIYSNPEDEAAFYVCLGDPFLGLIRYDFSCPEENYFDQMSFSCIPKAATSTKAPTTTITTPIPPFECKTSGVSPDPLNCKMYYRCSTSLKAFTYTCPGNSYFNENELKCSMTITPACQEQILKNSTLASTTQMSSILTTTVTAPTTISTTTSTTQQTTTSVTTTTTPETITNTAGTTISASSPVTTQPFICPGAGVFPSPVTCKIYYRCSTSGNGYLYSCPGSSYFNENTKTCGLAITPRCQKLLES